MNTIPADSDTLAKHIALSKWRKHLRACHGFWDRTAWSVGLLVLVGAIAEFDYVSGKSIHLFVLFLVPTIIAAWKLGLRSGLVFSALCATIGFGIDLLLGRNVLMLFACLNGLSRFFIFSLGAYGSWKIRAMGEALVDLSLIDPLTGLNNRRAFLLHGEDELNRMERHRQVISIFFIDLDDFKAVNDTLGHDAGDEVIRITADLLRHRVRKSDYAARLGGDEFAVILPSTNGAVARDIAGKVQTALRTVYAQRKFLVSASIGIATFSEAPTSFEFMLNCADKLMYEVKKSSKDAILQREIDVVSDAFSGVENR